MCVFSLSLSLLAVCLPYVTYLPPSPVLCAFLVVSLRALLPRPFFVILFFILYPFVRVCHVILCDWVGPKRRLSSY